ncbi:hypothetical protein AB833_22945 [Chromatiales bacterium (ex Bugula neritina AB1)]|nr:hypothetical protein AB833_22945 [Chromatiales bacterium (ex Bugula neritina AB1)]
MIAKINTSLGLIEVTLDPEAAPLTCENFKSYVDSGHYNGTIFHRVMPNFMVQGGGFTEDMQQKPTSAPIRNEASNGLKNSPGTIAMARTNDPHSATCQFFINVADNEFLNYKSDAPNEIGYCVFGSTTQGLDVLSQITDVATGNHGHHQNVPTEAITILSIELTE